MNTQQQSLIDLEKELEVWEHAVQMSLQRIRASERFAEGAVFFGLGFGVANLCVTLSSLVLRYL